ncbi:MAG: hypothetical protein U5K35_09400 [Rhodohalobacter sp.]|nr:hypothetical protein [Rhodohalobacter sp.]
MFFTVTTVDHAYGILDFFRIYIPQVETCGYDVGHGYAVWILHRN